MSLYGKVPFSVYISNLSASQYLSVICHGVIYSHIAYLTPDHTEVDIILELCRGVSPCLPLGRQRVGQQVLQVRDLLLQVSQALLLYKCVVTSEL